MEAACSAGGSRSAGSDGAPKLQRSRYNRGFGPRSQGILNTLIATSDRADCGLRLDICDLGSLALEVKSNGHTFAE